MRAKRAILAAVVLFVLAAPTRAAQLTVYQATSVEEVTAFVDYCVVYQVEHPMTT